MILVFIDLLSWLRLSGHSVRRFGCSPGFQDVLGTSGERRHGRALVPVMGGSGAGGWEGPPRCARVIGANNLWRMVGIHDRK